MASELSKFIDDELQKVETAEERERLISKLRVRTSAKDSGIAPRGAQSWQEQLLPRKRLLIIGLCVFFLIAIATVAISKGNASSKAKGLEIGRSSEYSYEQDQAINSMYPTEGEPSKAAMQHQGEIAPPGREAGVETNAPGSPATNVRDDEGSSVTPNNAGSDLLDGMPPVAATHKHAPPPPSNRKMAPGAPSTTPATASTKGHQGFEDQTSDDSTEGESRQYEEADEQSAKSGTSVKSSHSKAASEYPDEEPDADKSSDESLDGLAPSPELAEQRQRNKETADYEQEVERKEVEREEERQEARDSDSSSEEPYDSPTKDIVFPDRSPSGMDEEEKYDRESGDASEAGHSNSNPDAEEEAEAGQAPVDDEYEG